MAFPAPQLALLTAALGAACSLQAAQEGAGGPGLSGLAVYEKECLACHMADGRGVPGMAPALLQSPWLNGETDALIGFVLTGGYGPEVLMARFDYLSDEEMAAVLTYIRQAFAGGAAPVTPGQVSRVRAATSQQPGSHQGP